MKRDFLITFLAEFSVLAAGVAVYKLAASFLGVDGFPEYALSRRTASLLQPAMILGLGVGIPRYIAQAVPARGKCEDTYFVSGFMILLVVALAFLSVLNVFRDSFSVLLFGGPGYRHLIFPISLMLAGYVLHASAYSYYRGKLLMGRANVLQVLNLGVIPVTAFFGADDTKGVLTMTGIGLLAVSVPFLFAIAKGLRWDRNELLPSAKELLRYGVQRVPGDFGMAALLALPANFTAHLAGVKAAGHVAFGISLLSMAGAPFAPIGLILLPTVSRIIADGDVGSLKRYIDRTHFWTLCLSLAGVAFFEVFAVQIIGEYLGPAYEDVVLTSRVILLGGVAYAYYVSLRSVIDAFHVKGVNTINILVSLSIFLVASLAVWALKLPALGLTVGVVLSVFVLGGLTYAETRRISNHGQPD